MSVKLIVGLKGDGKTLFATYFAYQAYLRKRKVYANYHLSFPHEKLDLSASYNSLQYANCIIVIDEAQMYIDSRNFGKLDNRLFGYFFLQTRKRGVDAVMAAHQGGLIDIRVRENLDYIYRVTALVSDGVGFRRATIKEIENEEVEKIHVEKYSTRSGEHRYFLFDPERYFSMYNTHEFVDIMGGT